MKIKKGVFEANNLKLVKLISVALIMIGLCVGVFFIVRAVLNKGKDGNDTTLTATLITPDEAYREENYTNTINGSIKKDDKDYYSLVLLSDSYLTVTVNVTSSEMPYGYYLLNDTLDELASNINSSTVKKTESLYLEAGTYYILLQSYSSASKDYEVAYSLITEVKMADQVKTYDIGKLRYGKYLSAALWLSDYIPFDDIAPLSLDIIYDYLITTKKDTNNSKALYEYLNKISKGNKIKLLTYYLWDTDLLKEVIDIFKDLENKLVTNKGKDYTDKIDIDDAIKGIKSVKMGLEAAYSQAQFDSVMYKPAIFSVYYDVSLNTKDVELVYYPFNDYGMNFEFYTESNEIQTFQGYSNGNLYAVKSLRSSFNRENLELVDDVLYPKPKMEIIDNVERIPDTANGGMSWYSFTPTVRNTYSIIAHIDSLETDTDYSRVDYVLSVFKEEPNTTISDNYIISKHGGYFNGEDIGTLVTLDLEANETIYIKVSSKDGNGFVSGVLSIIQGIPPMEELPLS